MKKIDFKDVFNKSYDLLNFRISMESIDDTYIFKFIIDNEIIDKDFDIFKIEEDKTFVKTSIPSYVKDLFFSKEKLDIVYNDINNSLIEFLNTW